MADDKFSGLFKTAPKEVIRYFEAKKNRPSFDWREVAPQEHAFDFTVAKSAGFDILDDVRAAMADAIANRMPSSEFQRSLMPILQEKGWWGKALVTDPEIGETVKAQLGSPRRLRTIYWANTMTAHAAGEWERTERNKAFLPFIIYTLSTAERRRLQHERWVGFIAPVDDPVCDWLFPPNGWGCMCGTRQISRREALSLGWHDDMEGPLIIERPWTNKRTGKTEMVPEGIDPGWNSNPGKHRAQNIARLLTDKIEAMPAERQRIAIDDIVGSPMLTAMYEGRAPKYWLPVAQIPESVAVDFSATTSVVRLSQESVHHILTAHAERRLSVDDFRAAITTVMSPDGAVRRQNKSVVAFYKEVQGQWWRAAVKWVATANEWWLTSLHKKSAADVKNLLEAAKKKGERIY